MNCPVCWQRAKPTTGGNIAAHFDSVGQDVCPATGFPIHITIKGGKCKTAG